MRIIVIIYIMLIASSALAGTFRDDFEDGNFDGWTEWNHNPQPGKWQVEKGELVCRQFNYGWCVGQLWGDETLEDYTFEFDVKIASILAGKSYIAVLMRYTHEALVYGQVVHADKAYVGVWDLLVNTDKAGHSKAYNLVLGRWYHIKASVEDKNFVTYIDGELLFDFNHQLIPDSGMMGLACVGGEVHFDNVVITGDQIPDIGPSGYSVESKGKLAATWGQIRRLKNDR